MVAAAYTVDIDWDADGDFNDPLEATTNRILDARTAIQFSYGREQSRALSPISLAEAEFEIDNTSDDYNPENASSPLAGDLFAARDVRVQAVLAGVTYTLLRAHIDDYNVRPEPEQRSVHVTCLDPLAKLRNARITTDLYQGVRTGDAIHALLDAAGWPVDLRDIDPGVSLLPYWWADGDDAWTAMLQIVDSEGPPALVTADVDGRVMFRDRHHRLLRAASQTAQSTWTSGGAEPTYSAPTTYQHGQKEVINAVTFDVPLRAAQGSLSAVWSSQGRISVADGETVLVTARSTDPFIGAQTPQADIDFNLLSGVVEVTLSRTSGMSTTVFLKAVGGPAAISDLQLRAYQLATLATVQVQADDAVSIGKYGRRSSASDRDPVWASVHDAKAIADLILGQRAERLPTLTVTFLGTNTPRLIQQLSRDLSDRVTIVDTGTGLAGDFHLEQIAHMITQGGLEHTTTFGLEKVAAQVDTPLTFNVAGRGFNDGRFGATGHDDPDTMFLFDVTGQGFDQGLFAT